MKNNLKGKKWHSRSYFYQGTPTTVFTNSQSLIITTFKEEKLKYLYVIKYIQKNNKAGKESEKLSSPSNFATLKPAPKDGDLPHGTWLPEKKFPKPLQTHVDNVQQPFHFLPLYNTKYFIPWIVLPFHKVYRIINIFL